MTLQPPRDETELCERLGRLRGQSLSGLAAAQGVPVPSELRRSKGFAGQLLERALGATAASRSEPDFPHLGIELKSVPVDAAGKPLQSTFVASLELGSFDRRWETSGVRKKLQRVAWVSIEAATGTPLGDRLVIEARLWSPSAEEEAALRDDYEEIVELVDEGFGAQVTGHRGVSLQLRPKGKNAADLRWSLDEEGAAARTAPRAFYLRPAFTAALLTAADKPK